MFSRLPKETKQHVYSFLESKSLFNVLSVDKENKDLALHVLTWRARMKDKFHCLVPPGEIAWDLFFKLKKEKKQFAKKMQEPLAQYFFQHFLKKHYTHKDYETIYLAALENNREKLADFFKERTWEAFNFLGMCDSIHALKIIYSMYDTTHNTLPRQIFPYVIKIKQEAAGSGAINVMKDFYPAMISNKYFIPIFELIDWAFNLCQDPYKPETSQSLKQQILANDKAYKEIVLYLLKSGANPSKAKVGYLGESDSKLSIPMFCERFANQVPKPFRELFDIIIEWDLANKKTKSMKIS